MKHQLVLDAFIQAIGKERPQKGLIIHTDQGSNIPAVDFNPRYEIKNLFQV